MSAKLRALIRQLHTPEPVHGYEADVLVYGDAAVPHLTEVLCDPDAREDDAPGGGVAPAKAARLLGGIGTPAAVAPLLDVLATLRPSEFLYDAVASALADVGAPVVEPALARLAATDDRHARIALCAALCRCGVHDPRILAALRDRLADDAGIGALLLGEYGDPAAIPDLLAAFDAFDAPAGPYADAVLLELAEAVRTLGGEVGPERQARIEAAMAAAEEARREAAGRMRRDRRPGRNAPCWCGSGKRYKSCHEEADRA